MLIKFKKKKIFKVFVIRIYFIALVLQKNRELFYIETQYLIDEINVFPRFT